MYPSRICWCESNMLYIHHQNGIAAQSNLPNYRYKNYLFSLNLNCIRTLSTTYIIPCLLFSLFFLMYLLIIMGSFYDSLSHKQKCCILPMNDQKTGGEINQTMTTIRLWGIYHVHGLISLTRPGNDNWTRTPFKRILQYTIYNSYSSNG